MVLSEYFSQLQRLANKTISRRVSFELMVKMSFKLENPRKRFVLKRFKDQMRQFSKSEDGSISAFGFFQLIMILSCAGLAVDVLHFETQRVRLQGTLDRAVLAATNMSQALEPSDVVLDYFDKAGLSDYINESDIEVVETNTYRRVIATADMNVDTAFLEMIGLGDMTVTASSAAEESVSLTEVSLVLDVSGSMGSWSYSAGRSKIDELKNAATQFVNIMQCDPANPNSTTNCIVEDDQVSISVVPYAEQVLVGETLLSKFNPTEEHTSSSCVTFEDSDFQTTEITTTETLQRNGHFDPWSYSSRSPSSWTCDTDSWREVVPVTHDADTLRTAINNLGASGNTSIDIGMKWGTALLDPAAQPAIDDLIADQVLDANVSGRPYAWTKRGISKVIVLMTDGRNTYEHYLKDEYREGLSEVWYNEDAGIYSVYHEASGDYYWSSIPGYRRASSYYRWQDHPFGEGEYEICSYYYGCTTYSESGTSVQLTFQELWALKPISWYSQYSWLDYPALYHDSGDKNDRLDDICTAAKDQGVVIFSIGFEVSSSSVAVLRDCATSPSHYFDVDGLELTSAFHTVAREISKLRLIQ